MTLIERLLVQANKEANELADLLNEAAEALAQQDSVAWEHHAKKLTQWRHCMSYNDSYFGEPVGLVKQVTGELDRLIGTSPPASTATSEDVRPALAAVQAGERERCARICEKRANFEPEYTAAMLHEVAEVLRGA